jgi:hypothetical protein
MNPRLAPLLLSALLACSRGEPAPTPPASAASDPAPPAASLAPPAAPPPSGASAEAAPRSSPLTDTELGALIRKISEEGGKFPSDNYISNETSFLHVAADLENHKGGAYLGVGPEQNFTYLAILEPELAFVLDIRRDNLVLHLLYKVLFEESETRGAFLAALTSRPAPSLPGSAPVERVCEAVQRERHDPSREARTRQRVVSRAQALGLSLSADDRKHLTEALAAFGKKGMDIHYTMEGSARKYPPLSELLATRDDQGKPRSFLADEESYRKVRRMQLENRVIPLVGDLAGTGALPRLADELKRRNTPVRVFYVSNVEQYLFTPAKTWAQWIRNVRALPWADDGLLLRVYFDQGRAHPRQRPGHRTTSLTQPTSAFLARADKGGWKSWWEVTQSGEKPAKKTRSD